jgi:formiminotetrahydrofolate cyclodeaminase
MVCNLTVGRKKYAEVDEDMRNILAQSESLRAELTQLLEDDVAAFNQVSKAMKMSRDTEEQKEARAVALQEALKKATDVPMRVAEACVKVIELCGPAGEMGNINAVSDAGVGVLAAETGLRSAALNVLINLAWLDDEEFIAEQNARLNGLLEGKPEMKEQVYQLVVSKLG